MLVIGVALLVLVASVLPVTTGLGSRRRGTSVPVAVLAGLAFPLTWVWWYVHDEDPYRHADRAHAL
ncbi:hypothetical protein [Nocardioides cynanchi]|uniref:hypothetical protein n=1 Tax=Nocardioides cynanchi TaxID=2558918 RepID=UPI001247C42F|nr:hypothetical protein [Nocardioides cynanchi]